MKWIPRLVVGEDFFQMPELIALWQALGVEPLRAAGALLKFWLHAQQHCDWSGSMLVRPAVVDAIVSTPGFTAAAVKSGLLTHEGADRYTVSKYHTHVTHSAVKKGVDAIRQQVNRAGREGRAGGDAPGPQSVRGSSADTPPKKPGRLPSPPSLIPPETPLLTFPCSGPVPSWDLLPSQVEVWAGRYPGVDVLGEMRKALSWCEAATKKKTARGMPNFCVNWLNRATNSRGGGGVHPRPAAAPSASDLLREIEEQKLREGRR